jgi:hypothetical protein
MPPLITDWPVLMSLLRWVGAGTNRFWIVGSHQHAGARVAYRATVHDGVAVGGANDEHAVWSIIAIEQAEPIIDRSDLGAVIFHGGSWPDPAFVLLVFRKRAVIEGLDDFEVEVPPHLFVDVHALNLVGFRVVVDAARVGGEIRACEVVFANK